MVLCFAYSLWHSIVSQTALHGLPTATSQLAEGFWLQATALHNEKESLDTPLVRPSFFCFCTNLSLFGQDDAL